MKKYYSKRIPTWLKVLLWIFGIGALFCLIVLIYGSCTGQTFVEVLVDDWFAFINNSPATEEVEEVAETVSSILTLIRL